MDSSHCNSQWNSPPLPLLPPPPLPPPPPREPHPDSHCFYLPSNQIGDDYYLRYSHPPKPAINHPSSFYSQQPPPPQQHHLQYIPQQVSYESKKISLPSSSTLPCTESLDISDSALVKYNDKRFDSCTVDAAHTDRSREDWCVGINRGLDGCSRFCYLGHVRKESGGARIERNYQDRGQLKVESDRRYKRLDERNRSLSSRIGYVSKRYSGTLSRNGRRPLCHFNRRRREGSNDSKRTHGKQAQKKSALLRLETPRNHQNGRENSRNRSNYSGRRFACGKELLGRSDCGLVEKQRATPRSSKARRALVPDKSEKVSVTEENGNKSILKSHEDLLDRTGTGCKALLPKGMEIEHNVKTKTNTSPKKLLITWSTAADISGCSEARIRFAGMSMCSVGSQPCEDVDMDCLPSRNLRVMDVNAGFKEREIIDSSVGSLGYVDKDSSIDASIHFNSEDPGDQVLAKSDSGCIEDDNKGINKNVDSLSPEEDFCRGLPKGPVSSASLDISNVSGDLANAHSFTFTNTMVKSPDMSESKNPTHCEITVNPLVENENGSRTGSIETAPLNSAAEMADSRDSEKGKKACVKSTSSSLAKVDVKEPSIVERIDGCSGSDESGLAMAVPFKVCMENLTVERLVPDEDLGITSRHPAEISSVDQLNGSSVRRLEACLPEPDVSLSKGISDGSIEYLVQLGVRQKESTFCECSPNSPPLLIETNLAVGINGMSANESTTDADYGLNESQPFSTVCKFLPEDRSGCGSSGAFDTVRNLAVNKNLDEDPSRVSSCLVSDSYVTPCHMSSLVAVNEQVQNTTFIQANHSDSRGGIMHEENNCAENTDVDTQEEKTNPSGETLNYKTPGTDIVAVTRDSVFPCNSVSSSPGRNFRQIRSEIHVAPTVDETCKDKPKPEHSGGTSKYRTRGTNIFTFSGDSVPCDSLSNSPRLYRKIRSEVHVASMVDDTSNYKEKTKPSGGTSKCRTPEADVTSDVGGQEKYSLNRVKTDIFDGEAWSSVVSVSGNEILGASGVRLSSRYEIENRKKKSNYSTQKRYSRALPFVSDTKEDANAPNKRHTWHRKPDTSGSPFVGAKPLSLSLCTQPKFPIVAAQSSSSYVRKGNSLLRKPPSAIQLNRIKDKNTLEKQSNPPSDSSTSKVSNAIVTSSGKCPLSYSRDHLVTGLPESIMDSATSEEDNVPQCGGDASKTSDTLIQSDYASDCQQKRNHPKLDTSNLKRTVYVQRKANQLITASDIHGATKGQIPTSDGYFKRSKNQLVRTSASCVNHSPDDALDSQTITTMVSKRSSSSAFSDSGTRKPWFRISYRNRRIRVHLYRLAFVFAPITRCDKLSNLSLFLFAAVTRPYKRSKFSLVWTQNDPRSRLRTSHMRYQRILPQLVPWKRVTYRRRLMNSVSRIALRNGYFPNISQKFSMMTKRHTVYTRSTNGYSLRKSKDFSKKESEKHSGQSTTRMTSRNHLSRERVFRIGSLRYKMDSSRRTLQRISGVDSPCSGPTVNGKGSKRPFIPKRLVIGNEEYVRVGNGNQLVRDPKKRTRALADEKVRWSLHNARLRLAKKKKKYCQFFTRFGKCNKDDGKCPYVHDPSKIAVCTKFLNGLCANANCKLTHKVIPARMPDCSYFLQGLCNNEACPYRHVHVNPSAAICDWFLKGYCSDGDECRKKHSYTCPDFEATGSCCQGSKCKLHHPKNQSKVRKRKRPTEPSEKTSRGGRYFSEATYSADSGIEEGLDFIFLGATEYEAGDNNDVAAGASEEPFSVYNLIRPVALMQ